MTSDNTRPSPWIERHPWLIFLAILALVVLAWFGYAYWISATFASEGWPTRGQFGDSFGGLNALFSGLAFAALVIAVILQTRELALQRREMQDTREELHQAAIAAKASADALPKVERAYIFANVKLADEQIVATPSGNVNSRFIVRFFNHGKTPAIITMLRGYPDLVETLPEKLFTFPGSEERLPEGLVIASGESFTMPMERGISNSELGQIERQEKTLVCCGLIEYKDILGQVRETGYCWEYVYGAGTQGRFRFCRRSKLNYYN